MKWKIGGDRKYIRLILRQILWHLFFSLLFCISCEKRTFAWEKAYSIMQRGKTEYKKDRGEGRIKMYAKFVGVLNN